MSEGCSETKKKKEREVCSGCLKKLPLEHGGIRCVGGCAVCLTCSPSLVKATFDEMKFPLRCSCGNAIVVPTFERQLDSDTLTRFLMCMMQCDPMYLSPDGDDEVVEACPMCRYWHLSTKDAGRLLFFCRDKSCGVVSCLWCKKALSTYKVTDRRLKRLGISAAASPTRFEESKDCVSESAFDAHALCAELGPYKALWEDAIREGSGTKCPECNLVMTLAGGCTHMRCSQCRTLFCYMCGLSEANCDKAPTIGTVSIMQHQIGWKTNALRCPMWLTKLDSRYPDTNEKCVEFYHLLKTKRLLKACIGELQKKRVWGRVRRHFTLDLTSGFDIDDIIRRDHPTIVGRLDAVKRLSALRRAAAS